MDAFVKKLRHSLGRLAENFTEEKPLNKRTGIGGDVKVDTDVHSRGTSNFFSHLRENEGDKGKLLASQAF